MSSIRRILAQFLFDLCEKVDSDLWIDLCCAAASDTGEYGFCDDCDQRMSDEPSWCR